MREFGRSYYAATGKNFLETRVITFGNQLTPEVILRYGLNQMKTHAARHGLRIQKLDFLLGSVMAEFIRYREELKKEEDAFLAAFWAGYCLNRPKESSKVDPAAVL